MNKMIFIKFDCGSGRNNSTAPNNRIVVQLVSSNSQEQKHKEISAVQRLTNGNEKSDINLR